MYIAHLHYIIKTLTGNWCILMIVLHERICNFRVQSPFQWFRSRTHSLSNCQLKKWRAYGLFLLSIAKCNVRIMVGGVVDFLWREEEKFITKLEMPHETVQNPIDQVIKSWFSQSNSISQHGLPGWTVSQPLPIYKTTILWNIYWN